MFVIYLFMFYYIYKSRFFYVQMLLKIMSKGYIYFFCHTYEGIIGIFYYFDKLIDLNIFCVRKALVLTKYYIFFLIQKPGNQYYFKFLLKLFRNRNLMQNY